MTESAMFARGGGETDFFSHPRKSLHIKDWEPLERVKGIEPSYEAWEAAVLPLNYTRVALYSTVSKVFSNSMTRGRPTERSLFVNRRPAKTCRDARVGLVAGHSSGGRAYFRISPTHRYLIST